MIRDRAGANRSKHAAKEIEDRLGGAGGRIDGVSGIAAGIDRAVQDQPLAAQMLGHRVIGGVGRGDPFQFRLPEGFPGSEKPPGKWPTP